MRKFDTITLNGQMVQIKELTVAEVRHWMMDILASGNKENNTADLVLDQALFEGIAIGDLLRMTDLSLDQVDNFTPSQLQIVITKCKELNPDFFGMRQRLLARVSASA